MMTDDRISILKGALLCIQMNLESAWLEVCLPLSWGHITEQNNKQSSDTTEALGFPTMDTDDQLWSL